VIGQIHNEEFIGLYVKITGHGTKLKQEFVD